MCRIPWMSSWLECVFNYTIYRVDKGDVPHPDSEIYILPRKYDNSQTFNHVGADIMSRVRWYTGVQGHGIHIYSLEIRRFRSLPE